MKNKDYYIWKIIYPDGITANKKDKIDLNNIYGPCVFKLIPKVKGLKEHYLGLKLSQKLIYFRRVFGTLNTATNKNTVKNIIYFLGYQEGNYKEVKLIDIKNKNAIIKKGYNIEL